MCTPRNGDQVLYLFASGYVPGKRREWSGTGWTYVFHPRGAWGEMETTGYLFCSLWDVWLFAPVAIESTDSDCKYLVFEPQGWFVGSDNTAQFRNALFGLLLAVLVGMVVVGGIKRIGAFAARLVPGMVILYGGTSLLIILTHADQIFPSLSLILSDAFTGQAVAGGALGMVIVTGVRRAAFSNEAGMGTEAMAHGAAKTKEPIREGLVAMWGPVIDTLIMCTLTALVLMVTDVWRSGEGDGVLLTTQAFEEALPGVGPYLLLAGVLCLSFSSMLGFSYYVVKCGCFLFGQKARLPMLGFYLLTIVVSAVVKMDVIINFLDIAFGLMAIPTILSSIFLAPKVNEAAREYFKTKI